jgi:large subunit ribosomal protein L6
MSRIGKYPVAVPAGVTPTLNGQDLKVKGPKGELSLRIHDDVKIVLEEGKIRLSPREGGENAKRMWPTMRTMVSNMVEGVTKGYTKKLDIQGVGYRANMQGQTLVLQMGYSHDVKLPVPKGLTIQVENQTSITISGIDSHLVGQTAAEIREYRKPEPYKGKGIRYVGEYVQRKEGKKK